MKRKFSNKFNSYQGIVAFLMTRRYEYESMQKLADYADQFIAVVEEIKSLNDKTTKDFRSLTKAKSAAKNKMAEMVSAFASAGALMALEKAKHELKAEIEVTFSRIKYAKDAVAIKIARDIETLLLDHKADLEEYLITEEDFKKFHDVIEAYDVLYKTREKISDMGVIDTQKLETLFFSADKILKEKMDRFIKRLKVSMPDFYSHYFQARMIVDL